MTNNNDQITNNNDEQLLIDKFLSFFYDFLRLGSDGTLRFNDFMMVLAERHAGVYDSILLDPNKITYLSNLALIEKHYQNQFLGDNITKEIGIKNLKYKLNIISYMTIMCRHLRVPLSPQERSAYFDYLLHKSDQHRDFQRFVASQPTVDIENLEYYFVVRHITVLSGNFSIYHKELYDICNQAIMGDELPVLDYKKNDESSSLTEPTSVDLVNCFESITDIYYILKLMTKKDLTEEQFYTNVKKIDYSLVSNYDYNLLLYKAVKYFDSRSLSYLLTINNKSCNFADLIQHMISYIEDESLLIKNTNILLEHMDIDFCYQTIESYQVESMSIFEKICEDKRFFLWESFLKKSIDVSRIPNIDNFLEFSFATLEIDDAIEIFKLVSEYALSKPRLIYRFCYKFMYDKLNLSISAEQIKNAHEFFKMMNLNIFSTVDDKDVMLIHNFLKGNFLSEAHKDYVDRLLDYFFEQKPSANYWHHTHDSVGNNFVHLLTYSVDFMHFSHQLIKQRELLELFFTPDLQGKRPVDFVLKTVKKGLVPYVLGILNILINKEDSLFNDFTVLLDGFATDDPIYSDVKKAMVDFEGDSFSKIVKALNTKFPASNDFVMYDVYTKENVEKFEIYVGEMLPPDSTVKPWVNKLKTISGSKKLMFSTQLKKNLAELRRTFPNFKEFIDHVESYIYLNDMGDGYFWIPASLLVSAPGIGKTFFLHCLSKAVGVSYDMISMESVTAGFVLVGSSQQWSGGQPGLVFQNVFKSEYANNILILDEVDKTTSSNYPVEAVLLPLLETHTAQKFKDEFVNLPMDISKMIWVATANRLDQISDPIKSRFQVFNIPSPNFEERMILTQAIYHSLLQSNAWGKKFEKEISREILSELSKDKNSSRDLRKTISDACGRAAKRQDNKIIFEDLNILRTNKETLPWDKKHD
jgi:ATP-dependent Lon protease